MPVSKKWIIAGLTVLAVWISGFIAAPLLKTSDPATANFLYNLFRHTCHQISDRSFYLNESPLGVCARCTAIYFSGFFVLLVYVVKTKIHLLPLKIYILLSTPMLLDFILEKFDFYQNTIGIRTITGILFGITLFHLFIVSMQTNIDFGVQKKGHAWKTKE